jgi:Holliday junction resolvase RusA-like endonuclease
MQRYCIDIPPKPQGRPRFARAGKFVRTYDPPESRAYKDAVRDAIKLQCPTYYPDQAIYVSIWFHMPRPKRLRLRPNIPHIKRPDVDNLAKAILDALTGVLWRDDAQICRLHIDKRYTDDDYNPGIDIEVEEM